MTDYYVSKPDLAAKAKGEANKREGKLKETTLEERIKIYAENWVNGLNKRDSYASAGYGCPTHSNAALFHKRYLKEINEAVVDCMHNKVPTALKVLEEIMLYGKSETARTKAALEMLDRAGFDKQTRIAIGHEEPKSQEELQAQLKALLATNAKDLKFLESGS